MQIAVMVCGALAVAAGWGFVAAGRRSVLRILPAIHLVLGVLSFVVRDQALARDVSTGRALVGGLASGFAMYVATRIVVSIAVGSASLRRQVELTYASAEGPLVTQLAASLIVSVPGEELFWRGLFLPRLGGGVAGVAASTLAYVGANAPSRRAPIVAGALVGGALWTGLAAWSGGVLAPIASHMLWTGLMLALPPSAARSRA